MSTIVMRAHSVSGSAPPVAVLTAAGGVITPNAAIGANLYRHIATTDVTLASPTGGVDGQRLTVMVVASGGTRVVSFSGGTPSPVTVPAGDAYVADLLYEQASDVWWIVGDGSGGGSSGGSSGISPTIVTAKGDLLAATGSGAVTRVGVGADGQALVVTSGASAGVGWAAPTPAAHTHAASDLASGLVSTARLATGTPTWKLFLAGDQTWSSPNEIPVDSNPQTGTAYTLTLNDAGVVVEMSNAAANTVTIPPNSSVPFPVGQIIEICQAGTGQTTIASGGGVAALRTPSTLSLRAQWSTVTLRQRATNEWVLAGDLQ
jgi:hypothetical protein